MKNKLAIAGISLMVVAATVASGPALAQTTTFNFKNCTNQSCTTTTNSPTIGAPGNSITFWNSNNTISAKATAWSLSDKNAAPKEAYLGWYDQGLGITNNVTGTPGHYSTGDSSHTIDNVGTYDFVLLEFSTFVQFKKGTLTPFDVVSKDGKGADNDPSVSFTRGPAGSFLNAAQQDDLRLHTTELSGKTDGNFTFDLNPGGNSGNMWTIGANRLFDLYSGRDDGFKLTALEVMIPTPEPASWAMMIGGFGITGGSLRRRRAPQAKVALA